MRSKRECHVVWGALTLVLTAAMAGSDCQTAEGPAGLPVVAPIGGTWVGTIDWEIETTFNGQSSPVQHFNQQFEMTFSDQGAPSAMPVAMAGATGSESADFNIVGQTVEMQTTMNDMQTTQTMTITEADYAGSSMHVVIEFTLVTTGGGMEMNGEGTQTLDARVEGDALSWTQTMTQDVTQTSGGQTSTSTTNMRANGTLQRK